MGDIVGKCSNSSDQHSTYRDDLFLFPDYTDCDTYENLLRRHPSCKTDTPLDQKRKRLLLAVTHDDLDEVKKNLDSSKLYNTTDRIGLNLLQIAIIRNSVKVFDFIVTVPGFPLDLTNAEKETALTTSLSTTRNNDYFAEKLIQNGANINQVDFLGRNILYRSIFFGHGKITKLLVQRGANLDGQDHCGESPLHVACRKGDNEVASFLLSSGADPRSEDMLELTPYDIAVVENNEFLQEILFNCTFDKYSGFKVQWEILLHLARHNPGLFDRVEDVVGEVFHFDPSSTSNLRNFFALDIPVFKDLIKRFRKHVRRFLSVCDFRDWRSDGITLEKVEILRRYGCLSAVIRCIQNTKSDYLIENLINLDEANLTSIVCYLLSYGLEISEYNLQDVFRAYGYCDLFRIMLHFENSPEVFRKEIMPCMIYDIRMSLDKYLNYYTYSVLSQFEVHLLLHYFSHPKLKDICLHLYGDAILDCVRQVPEVPCLVELARNVFRKYLITRFDIKSSKDFFGLLNALQIGRVHKRIISYETKLYGKCEVKWRSLTPIRDLRIS